MASPAEKPKGAEGISITISPDALMQMIQAMTGGQSQPSPQQTAAPGETPGAAPSPSQPTGGPPQSFMTKAPDKKPPSTMLGAA